MGCELHFPFMWINGPCAIFIHFPLPNECTMSITNNPTQQPITVAKQLLSDTCDTAPDNDASPHRARTLFHRPALPPEELFDGIDSSDSEGSNNERGASSQAHSSSAVQPQATAEAPTITPLQATQEQDIRKHCSGSAFEYNYSAVKSPAKRQRQGEYYSSQSSPELPSSQNTPAMRQVTDIPGRYFDEDDDSDFEPDIFSPVASPIKVPPPTMTPIKLTRIRAMSSPTTSFHELVSSPSLFIWSLSCSQFLILDAVRSWFGGTNTILTFSAALF